MSRRKPGTFTLVDLWVAQHPDTDTHDLAVWMWLLHHEADGGGSCTPSVALLAAECKSSRRKVEDSLQKLTRIAAIRRVTRYRDHGQGRTSSGTVLVHTPPEGTPSIADDLRERAAAHRRRRKPTARTLTLTGEGNGREQKQTITPTGGGNGQAQKQAITPTGGGNDRGIAPTGGGTVTPTGGGTGTRTNELDKAMAGAPVSSGTARATPVDNPAAPAGADRNTLESDGGPAAARDITRADPRPDPADEPPVPLDDPRPPADLLAHLRTLRADLDDYPVRFRRLVPELTHHTDLVLTLFQRARDAGLSPDQLSALVRADTEPDQLTPHLILDRLRLAGAQAS